MLASFGKLKGSCPIDIPEILSEPAVVILIPSGMVTLSIRGVVLSARWIVQPESEASGVGAGSPLLSLSL